MISLAAQVMHPRWPASLALVVLVALALSGCDSPTVQDCEKQLLNKLKAPSTYKRIGVNQMAITSGQPPHYYMVEIEYDAQNSYGALLRDKEICSYRLDKNGAPTTEMFEPYAGIDDNVVAAAEAAVDNALNEASNVVGSAGAEIEEAQEAAPYSEEYDYGYEGSDVETSEAESASDSNVQNAVGQDTELEPH